MVMAAVFAVFAPCALEHAIAFQVARVVGITDAAGVFFAAFGKFVGIDEGIIAGVVGRVDINHFYAAGIGFLQDFQGFEIFGLDKHVLRTVEIYRFFPTGGQRIGSGALQVEIGGCFARPIELIAFARVSKIVRTEDKFEFFKVNFLFAKDFGEEGF